MKILRLGSEGDLVVRLQTFLNNFVEPDLFVDGDFGPKTHEAVKVAQRAALSAHLSIGTSIPDGIVGPKTASAFMQMGWQAFDPEKKDPNFHCPVGFRPLTQLQKIQKFGSPGNAPEDLTPGGNIVLNQDFHKNLVTVDLNDFFSAPLGWQGPRRLTLHKSVEKQWRALFRDVADKGLGDRLLSCGGSWNPRYVRGSISTFSSHAFGTAIDFNAPQNWLGATPAAKDETGYLGEIVALASAYWIYWGGWFRRLDGMHFESTLTDEELSLLGAAL